MSFLTPLYVAGFLTVALPIVFHLIRRTPSGRQPFSTLMFLRPSPPRMTRRSRLENWPLLLLRALALVLLALAFARPFWRQASSADAAAEDGRQVAVLLDTSASMRRDDLWSQAVEKVKTLMDQTEAHDELALFTFDRRLHTVLGFEESAPLGHGPRRQLLRERLDEISPGWGHTDLGAALIGVVGALEARASTDAANRAQRPQEIVLISDLQSGMRLESLQTYVWPEQVRLRIERVATEQTTNAGVQFVGGELSTEDSRLRVRVSNAADSAREQFRLRWWTDSAERTAGDEVQVYVPPGQSRIVRAPAVPKSNGTLRLRLEGDDHDFDNVAYSEQPTPDELTVLYFGSEQPDNPAGARYYVERALADTPRRTVKVTDKTDALQPGGMKENIPLAIVTDPLETEQAEMLVQFAKRGGTVLIVADEPTDCDTFGRLVGAGVWAAEEAGSESYAMLTNIDFEHPMFAPLSDARFADFTKIHIWKHHIVDPAEIPKSRVLARFDDGNPAVLESPLGAGRVLLATSGWRPEDSQLVLSSKFVVLLNALLDYSRGDFEHSARYHVGDSVPVPRPESAAPVALTMRLPDQTEVPIAQDDESFTGTVMPGVYTVAEASSTPVRFAVNVAPEESRTSPMPIEQLEAFGLQLEPANDERTADRAGAHQRQLKARELERRQQMWRWLILGAVLVLFVETWLAARTTRRVQETASGG